jgi:hypothetical protein
LGCTKCDNSVNFSNLDPNEKQLFGGVAPNGYDFYSVSVAQGFSDKAYIQVNGSFALGTFIIPVATTGKMVYDTSWTNTGLITGGVMINPTGGVPEPSTWVMGVLGFGILGAFARQRSKLHAWRSV